MHKKLWILGAAAVLTMSLLAGCMPSGQSDGDAKEGGFNPFGRQEEVKEKKPEKLTLSVYTKGRTVEVPAERYKGKGYQIAIAEDWERSENEPQWKPYENDEVALTVRYYNEKKPEEVMDLLYRAYPEYDFGEPEDTSFEKVEQVVKLEARAPVEYNEGEEAEPEASPEELLLYVVKTREGCFAIVAEYPMDVRRTYSGYLKSMVETFELVKEEPNIT